MYVCNRIYSLCEISYICMFTMEYTINKINVTLRMKRYMKNAKFIYQIEVTFSCLVHNIPIGGTEVEVHIVTECE